MNNLLDLVGYVQQQGEKGTAERKAKGLASLSAQFAQGSAPDYQGIAANGGDPMKFREDAQKRVGQIAGVLANADPQTAAALYQQFKPQLAQIGMTGLPDNWDESLRPTAQAFAQQYGSGGQSNQLPADIQTMEYYKKNPDQFDRQMQLRRASANPFGFQTITGVDGVERLVQTNKREGGAAEIGPGGVPVGMGAGPGAAMPIMALATTFQKFGGQISSGYRNAQHNAQVGGVPNSQHMAGTALDVVFPTPQLKAQAKAFGEANGYEVIDEGDHLHFERPSNAGPNPYASRPAEVQAGMNAAATENAKIGAQVGNTAAVAQSEAQIAAAKALAENNAKAQSEREAKIAQRTQNAGTALDLLQEAESILPNATGSGIGSARDTVAAVFGKSTRGAQGAARLKTIAGQLILMQPRMEGPQSDADRKLYAAMAGDLGDESKPVETRLSALQGMKKLQTKYANNGAPQKVSTQAQFDALPSGAIYISTDGKPHRKP